MGLLVAPLVPLVCLALVLWLDRLEESLDASRMPRPPAGVEQATPEPTAGSPTGPGPALAVAVADQPPADRAGAGR